MNHNQMATTGITSTGRTTTYPEHRDVYI
jgi:hypothetical protein